MVQVPYTMVQFAVFETAVRFFKGMYDKTRGPPPGPEGHPHLNAKEKLSISLASGLVAGVAASIASQPGDTILSKINQVRRSIVGITAYD